MERLRAKKRKMIVVTFGGGARDQETFAPDGQANIPHMLGELAPQSSFFTQVTNHGILGHYVATASLATGVYETLNNFSAVPPDHPTVFEYFRKDLRSARSRTPGWSHPATGSIALAKAIVQLWSGIWRAGHFAQASAERGQLRQQLITITAARQLRDAAVCSAN
jgi:hypothetical protein